ncbi:hypothetical protein COCVIDRAFT_33554 [Bipolaris victoriae FI3]|uniref:Uncharacterized protein n=1 Tax=Bipolaris victoriae (strain FI3) TaxID=930091 RepID=W7F1F6_BIPV3|nr:hypothetical protein COCVIDRAFT_33554 [Bipolaris victoriae FI3]
MTATASMRPYAFDRQQSLLQLDCSADLRHYSRNLGPGVQERIFQTTSDALRTQLDEHRDFLLKHQRQQQQQQQPHLAPVPVPSGPEPALAQPYTHARPYAQPPQPPSVSSVIPAAIATRSPTKTVPGDINTYPLALREALYSQKSAPQAHDGRTIYHVVASRAGTHSSEEAAVVTSRRNMVVANEVAAQYFLENYLENSEEIKYKQLGNGALSCEAVRDKQRISVYVQEAKSE